MPLTIGKPAPEFTLPDQTGTSHALAQYRGKWVLLYFYPKDDTPGCTTEACTIRDQYTSFTKRRIVVLGVSADSVKSHAKFSKKFDLPFPLLADTEKEVVRAYGVWGKKTFMGRSSMGTKRTSFLIDPKGKVVKIYEDVRPAAHADEVLGDQRARS